MNESQGELQTDTSALYSSTFAQVIFVNVEKLYMTDIPVKCNYTLTPLINAHKKDWIGIFKVGWSTARDYHTFVWAPLPKEDSQVERQQQVTFEAYYLPKDNNDFYQFCYVTHKGEIRGASTPFGFRLANSSMSEHMDSDSSQEMLIITTQDKLEESEREKDELTGNNLRLMEENTSLKKTIEELETQAEQDKEGHSGALEMNKKDVMALEKQMSEQKVDTEMKMRARSEKTEQLRTELTEKEAACLNAQKENQDLRAKMESAWASVGQSKQKYEQAADKMKQLQQETETLKMEIGTKETELTSLSGTKKQIASELRMVQDNLKLVQFDFDSQKKENEKLKEHLKKMTEVEVLLQNQTAEICHLRHGLSDYEKLKVSNSNTGQLQEQLENLRQHLKGTEGQLQLAKQWQIQTAAERRAAEADREKSDANLHDAHQDIQNWKSKFQKIDQILSKREFDFDTQKKENEKLKEHLKKMTEVEVLLKNQTAEICHLRHGLSDYEKLKASNSNTGQLQEQVENLRQHLKGTEEQLQLAKQRQIQTAAERRAAEADREKSDANLHDAHQDIQHWKSKFQKIDQILSKREVAFTEIERELEDKTHIVDIRTLEVADLQEQIRKLNKMIDELRVGPSHQSGAFQLEHPNPYSLTVPKVHSGQAGLLFGNPYSQCSVKGSQTVTSIDFVQNLDGQENSQDADEEHIDSQKCPVCEVLFPLNLEDFDFEQHVLKHFVYECPVCQSTFPENRQAAYEDHVESHFSEVN